MYSSLSNSQGHSRTLDALRKTKKNVRKVFKDTEDAQLSNRLHSILSTDRLKTLIQVYSTITQPWPVDDEEVEEDLHDLIKDVVDDLSLAMNGDSEYSQECVEVLSLLSSPRLRFYLEAVNEVRTENFYVPDLPSTGLFTIGSTGPYGTLLSLPTSQQLRTPSLVDNFGSMKIAPSAEHSSVFMNMVPSANHLGSAPQLGAPTLTGGGEGLRLRPVEGSLKIISILKAPGEDLGITIGVYEYESAQYGWVSEIYVKRVMAGSQIEKQGLLKEGDIIREINGVVVDKPETLQEQLKISPETVTMKIIPAFKEKKGTTQVFIRAHCSYNPELDTLLPCKEAGLSFKFNDILQVMNQDDSNWWQARHYNAERRAGLIPSIVLQERRKAFIQSAPDPNALSYKFLSNKFNNRKKKKTVEMMFKAREADEYETKDIVVYEEIALISGFQRPVICLIGADGVGRRTLRDMLIQANSTRYGLAIPHTSRPKFLDEADGDEFYFQPRLKLEREYQKNCLIEYGEFEGHLYGTKLETIRDVIRSNRTCLLDCVASAVRLLRTSEFMPYVVFLASPSVSCMKAMYEYGRSMGYTETWKRDEEFRKTLDDSQDIERTYRHLFDYILLCDNIEVTFEKLAHHLDDLLTTPQWVPAKWLY